MTLLKCCSYHQQKISPGSLINSHGLIVAGSGFEASQKFRFCSGSNWLRIDQSSAQESACALQVYYVPRFGGGLKNADSL